MDEKTRARIATGVMFIILGLGLYGMQFLDERGESFTLVLLGGLSVAAYLSTRSQILLVAGGILLGLGIGSFGERTLYILGEMTKVGLGIGFLLIYLIRLAYERRSHWWPLIPAAVFFLLGFNAWHEFRVFVLSSRGWPLILVIIGVLMLLGAVGGKRRRRGKVSG